MFGGSPDNAQFWSTVSLSFLFIILVLFAIFILPLFSNNTENFTSVKYNKQGKIQKFNGAGKKTCNRR
jgi:hypothetical protein